MDGLANLCAFARRVRLLPLALASLSASANAAAQDGGWQLDPRARVEIGAVNAKAATEDYEFIYIGDAVYFRGQAGLEIGNDSTSFAVEVDRIMVERFDEDRPATDRDRLTATFVQDLGQDWGLELQLRRYDDFVSAEFNDTDALEMAAQVQYEPVRAHRFRFEFRWREREYDDSDGPEGGSTRGNGPKLSAAYRYRLGRYHYISLDLDAEGIDSDNPVREFARQSISASYTRPITRTLRLRPALAVRHTSFSGRLAPDGTRRDDTYMTPELEALWWTGHFRVEAEAKYVIAGSNDPDRDRKGHRLSLSIGYAF